MKELEEVQAILRRMYGPTNYYTTRYWQEEAGYWGNIPEWIKDIRQAHSQFTPVLDVGPGYGTLLGLCKQLGYEWLVGADRMSYISREVSEEFALTLIHTDIEREDKCLNQWCYGLVIMTEVLEHFNFHPVETLKRIKNSISANGALLLSTPDADSWGRIGPYKKLEDLPKFNKETGQWNLPAWEDKHVWQYTEAELLYVLMKSGFRIEKMERSRSSGGVHFNAMATPLTTTKRCI